ncbi:MAG TPA: PHP domain-containing protein, partial [Pseudomonas sp.]|nr:PHP domain-containing protein [Pseudomonas sp.]
MNAGYAELHCLSNFSFQRGASSAQELFERAKRLGYQALAITDECTLAGIVRAWQAAKASELPLIIGSEMHIEDGPKLVLLVSDLAGYQALCRLITLARRRAEKGSYRLLREDFDTPLQGLLAIWLPGSEGRQYSDWLRERFGADLWLGVALHRGPDDARQLQRLLALADELNLRAVACGDVHMHARGRRALQDCMAAIRHHLPVAEAGQHLFANGERHLRRHEELAELYPSELLAETLRIAERCHFDLGQLKYEYPREL